MIRGTPPWTLTAAETRASDEKLRLRIGWSGQEQPFFPEEKATELTVDRSASSTHGHSGPLTGLPVSDVDWGPLCRVEGIHDSLGKGVSTIA